MQLHDDIYILGLLQYTMHVFICIFLSDYVKLCELLFNSLDFQSSGKVDKILSEIVNEQLKAALANTRTDARK